MNIHEGLAPSANSCGSAWRWEEGRGCQSGLSRLTTAVSSGWSGPGQHACCCVSGWWPPPQCCGRRWPGWPLYDREACDCGAAAITAGSVVALQGLWAPCSSMSDPGLSLVQGALALLAVPTGTLFCMWCRCRDPVWSTPQWGTAV